MSPEKRFYSRQEICHILGISLSSLNRGVRNKTWPFCKFVRIGNRILFPNTLLDEIQLFAELGIEHGPNTYTIEG
jgi:hypothetical protein